jgi:hypothetical protein
MFRNVSQINLLGQKEKRKKKKEILNIIVAVFNDTKTSIDNMKNVIKQKTYTLTCKI